MAFLGSLDPMSGDESFQVVKPVGARTVPQYLFEPPLAHFQEMCDALSREAISRGAKRPPSWNSNNSIGSPVGLSTLNGTIRYMFPLKREHSAWSQQLSVLLAYVEGGWRHSRSDPAVRREHSREFLSIVAPHLTP